MKQSINALMVVGSCAILTLFAVALMNQGRPAAEQSANASAAFRDGMFQARLAAQRGDRPQLTAGRWSNNRDRRDYVEGYQQGYVKALGQDGITVPQGAEQAGYRHGLADGALDRQSGQAFRNVANRGDNVGVLSDPAYHQAYATGYQLSYYGEQQLQNALVIRPVVSPSY